MTDRGGLDCPACKWAVILVLGGIATLGIGFALATAGAVLLTGRLP